MDLDNNYKLYGCFVDCVAWVHSLETDEVLDRRVLNKQDEGLFWKSGKSQELIVTCINSNFLFLQLTSEKRKKYTKVKILRLKRYTDNPINIALCIKTRHILESRMILSDEDISMQIYLTGKSGKTWQASLVSPWIC